MDLMKAIAGRRSIRSYTDQPVDDAVIDEIMSAGLMAPNAVNQQPWSFVVVRDSAVREKLVAFIKEGHYVFFTQVRDPAYTQDDARDRAYKLMGSYDTVPAWIVAFRIPRHYLAAEYARFERDVDIESVCAAFENMLLVARARGLATCWTSTTVIMEKEVKALLGAPEGAELIAVSPLGHPAKWPETAPAKRPIQEIVFRDHF